MAMVCNYCNQFEVNIGLLSKDALFLSIKHGMEFCPWCGSELEDDMEEVKPLWDQVRDDILQEEDERVLKELEKAIEKAKHDQECEDCKVNYGNKD